MINIILKSGYRQWSRLHGQRCCGQQEEGQVQRRAGLPTDHGSCRQGPRQPSLGMQLKQFPYMPPIVFVSGLEYFAGLFYIFLFSNVCKVKMFLRKIFLKNPNLIFRHFLSLKIKH